MAEIRVQNLRKSFLRKSGEPLEVLSGVDFSVKDKEFCCLLGVSGCGKSTVLNIISCLTTPDSGEIIIGENHSRHPSARIGYVFQQSRLLNWKTVRENLTFVLRTLNFPRGEWDRRVEKYIKLVGLEGFADEYPLSLSGGMQQRVSIARALVIDPDVLLMDEPFSHLDELTARGLRRELLRIWHEEEKTIIFVTHNALEAVYLADTIFLFSKRPTRIIERIEVAVPRARELEDPRLIKLQKEIVSILEAEAADIRQ